MNLREELNKDKEKLNKEEEITDREKIFIEYIRGNEVSQEDENKILDELQSCIDKKSYFNSIYERELEYCSNLKCTEWKRLQKDNIHYKYIINQLGKVKTLPKAIQLVLKNTEHTRNLISYNNFLIENDIKPLQDNYTINDLENTIFKIAEKNKNGRFIDELEFPNIENCKIEDLFSFKDNNYVLLDKKHRFGFTAFWARIIYIKELLKDDKILFGRDIIDYGENSSQKIKARKIGLENSGLKTYYIKNFNICKNQTSSFLSGPEDFIIYKDLSDNEIEIELNKYKVENKKWNNAAKKLLEPFVNKLLNGFKDLEIKYNGNKSDFIYKEKKLKLLLDTKLKEDVKNKKIVHLSGEFCINDLIIIDGCFFALIKSLNSSKEELEHNVHYGAFSDKDGINSSVEERENKVDLSTPYTNTNKASVVGRTIVGQALGGQIGGLLGAYSAIEENKKRSEMEENHEPIIVTSKWKEVSVHINCFYTPTNEKDGFLNICVSTNTKYNDVIERWIEEIKSASNKENLKNGKIIRDYFEKNSSIEFDEDDLNSYIVKKRRNIYWDTHKEEKNSLEKKLNELKKDETNIKNEILNIDIQNKPQIDKIKEKYNNEFEEDKQIQLLTSEVNDLVDKEKKLSFLKISEKRKIKNLIMKKNTQIEQLKLALKNSKELINKKIKEEIDIIEQNKKEPNAKLEENLKQQQNIIDELEKNR